MKRDDNNGENYFQVKCVLPKATVSSHASRSHLFQEHNTQNDED